MTDQVRKEIQKRDAKKVAAVDARNRNVAKHDGERPSVKVTMAQTPDGKWVVETRTRMPWKGTWNTADTSSFDCEMEAIFELNKVQACFSKEGWRNVN